MSTALPWSKVSKKGSSLTRAWAWGGTWTITLKGKYLRKRASLERGLGGMNMSLVWNGISFSWLKVLSNELSSSPSKESKPSSGSCKSVNNNNNNNKYTE